MRRRCMTLNPSMSTPLHYETVRQLSRDAFPISLILIFISAFASFLRGVVEKCPLCEDK
jgi:hypothetical protein